MIVNGVEQFLNAKKWRNRYMKKYTQEEIMQAFKPSFEVGLLRCYGLETMAYFMFLEGMKFVQTGEIRKIDYDNIQI